MIKYEGSEDDILKYAAKSELGLIRKSNQDRVLVVETDQAFLAMVCDGIGGGKAGDVASQMTIDFFEKEFKEASSFEKDSDIIHWYEKTLKAVNERVFSKGRRNLELQGMGTTAITLIIKDGRAFGFNVGDSRLYDYRHNSLDLLSHDQTYAYMMYLENEITKEEAENHPKRNVLMNAIGVKNHIEYETIRVPDDWNRLMLSSDGLHDYVALSHIEETFNYDIEKTTELLMELAYKAGGFDNISLVVIEGDKNDA